MSKLQINLHLNRIYKWLMVVKKIFKIHYIVFFLALFLSKAIAEPTFVQSKAIAAKT